MDQILLPPCSAFIAASKGRPRQFPLAQIYLWYFQAIPAPKKLAFKLITKESRAFYFKF
ncbi:unnamed protein product [Oikopleura dioica]|uniref:Uncharacterized protein n=1 Tax=Oikopleura dioica TaxID=34765 RepID=E4YT11_OIKDI|nr:unnamed protein product [Oikopleura dioica]